MSVTNRKTVAVKAALKRLRRHIDAILGVSILVIVAFLVFRNFLFLHQWPTGGDALGWVGRSYLYKDNARWLHMWRPYSFGFVEIINGLDFFLSTTYQVLQDAPLMVEVFMFLSFLLAAASAYAFAFHYTHRHLSAFSASLIYVLNQWLTSQLFEVHLEIVFSYAFAPLLFLFLDRALEKTRSKDILAAALVLSVMVTSFHAECIVIYGVFIALFIIFYMFIPSKKDPFPNRVKRTMKVLPTVAIIGFLVSSFVILPFLMNAKPQYFSAAYTYSLEEARVYGFKDIARAFTLSATENWGYVKIVDYQNGLHFPGYPMIITTSVIFLCYTTLFIRRNKYTIFFAFATILATCIAMGPNPPFDRFFIWMWYNIPHFSVFRAVSRWIMIVALSHAFFVSQFTDMLANYVKRRRIRRWNRVFFKMETKHDSDRSSWTTSIVSVSFINRIVRRLHELFFNLSMLMLVLIIAAPFFSNFFVLNTGLRVYSPNQNYLAPYNWVRDQTGDFRIVTVGQHPGDFADAAMSTDSGWGHEIGSESSFIHDKPVLQDGGWESLPHNFVSYLRNRVVPDKMSDNMMNILSAFNYRFAVIPSYASSTNRDFFQNQKGTSIVYDSGSEILEATNVNQRLFGTTQYYTVIGNVESLVSLYKIDSFNLHQNALFFADQLGTQFYEYPFFTSSKATILVDSSLVEMLMLSLRENGNIITMDNYGAIGIDERTQWIQSTYWKNVGQFTFGEKTIVTSGKKDVDIQVELKTSGNYDIWIRVLFAQKRGTLTIAADNTMLEQLKPLSNGPSIFSWVKVGGMQMQAGSHLVSLSNDGSDENDVDALAIIEKSVWEDKKSSIENALANHEGYALGLFEAENIFNYNASSGWRYETEPYNGFVLKSDEKGSNAALESSANASTVYNGDVTNFGAQKTIDDLNITRWASGLSMPQWLEISWSTPKELSGAEILFENAKAQDYVIQAWNGTGFMDLPETNTIGNNETVRYHRFSQSVTTSKLRLYITSAPEYDMASIYEFRAYTEGKPVSAEIYIPKTGSYNLGFRLLSNASSGIFYFKLGNYSESVWCKGLDNDYKWFYSQTPIQLKQGNQTITVSGVEEIAFDTMLIFPATYRNVSEIFTVASTPTVRYVRINSGEYQVDIETQSNFLLVLSESHHPLWRAYIYGAEVRPTVTDYFLNGFLIDRNGTFSVRISFIGQSYTDIGLKLSVTTLFVTLAVLAIPSKFFKKVKTRLESLERRV